MSKRVLVLVGNPKDKSFSNHLAKVYVNEAEKHCEVRLFRLYDMEFNPDLVLGYDDKQELEPCLVQFQQALVWSEHLVIITPIWWGVIPAKLKGLFDRTFLPNFAFKYQAGKSIPIKLLKGKTSRLIMTMDTPPWYYWLVQGAPALKQLKTATLAFCGFKSVKSNMLGPIINSSEAARDKWIKAIAQLGQAAK
ncbi:NAD(P)H-dependent oxidoreductase [Shewanella sp.]|uniref:NAD(P)H-dependent oxidoreductase n=1 Tax=Shewanella sp. TaxID=50422 RepID=UPI0040540763